MTKKNMCYDLATRRLLKHAKTIVVTVQVRIIVQLISERKIVLGRAHTENEHSKLAGRIDTALPSGS